MKSKLYNRLVLIGLALLFFTPVALAWWLYFYGAAWQPQGRVNQGELVQPPVTLQAVTLQTLTQQPLSLAAALNGKWNLVTAVQADCDAVCDKNLYKMRQIRLALNKNMERVQRILLIQSPQQLTNLQQLQNAYGGTQLLTGDTAELTGLFTQLEETGQNSIYLLDPLGNLVLRYGADAEAGAILKDLKRLLKLSNIG